jgi:hypothetical protein
LALPERAPKANRLRDIVELAAPQPTIGDEIRIAFAATATGSVARRAIGREGLAPERTSEIGEHRVGDDLLQ